MIVSTVVAALAAFAIARMRFHGRDFLLSLNVALMVVPPVVMLIPLFIQFTDLGLVSTYRGVILIYAGLTAPFSVYLLTSFFRAIPNELFESATIDGAVPRPHPAAVVLPLSRPALVTLVIVNALWVWNELLIALVFLPRDELQDADGGRDAVPGPVHARRAAADGGHADRVGADGAALPRRAALLHPRPDGRGAQGIGGTEVRRFEGRSVVVTGAGRGIGQATAERFASEGADVTLIGRSPGPLGGGRGGHPRGRRAGDRAPVRRALRRRRRRRGGRGRSTRMGKLDVLINNAGIDDDTPFLDIDRDRWLDVVATNLTGPFLMSQAAARAMRAAGGGVILHNASIDASGGDGPFAAYNASKAGLLGLNRTMALELAQYGIRSNCVSPGFTHTQMTESAVGPKLMEYLNGNFDRVPMRRLVKPSEIAAGFAFLASDDASGHHRDQPRRSTAG